MSVNPAKHAASVHGVLSCTDCHSTIKDYPHPAKVARVKCATCHEDQTVLLPKSVHGVLGEQACESCHGNHHEISAASAALTKCATCHGDEVKALNVSIHGQAAAQGDPDAPKCASCHGAVHQIQGSSEPASMVAKKNLPETCASCHSNQQFLSRHSIPFAHPVELYKQSVHGRKLAQGDGAVATCSDCHGSHEILPAQDARSKINHWNLPATCGQCHAEIAKTYGESVHGQAIKAGVAAAPVCSDCHGEHLILEPQQAGSLVNASRVSTVTCGRCHSDERLALRYNLPTDRVPSYADSYHGLAMRGGSQIVANCASCHGVHNIFRSSDARSTVNSANLARTCGACHAGAGGTHFSIGPVHVLTASGPNHPVVKWIRWTYWVLIPMTLGFMLLHNLLDLVSKLVRGRPRHVSGARVTRMARNFRIAHAGVIMSFPVLVFTGFALKFPEAWWARPILLWERHFAFRGAVHRSAAVIITVATLYHFLHLALVRKDRLFLKAMMPGWRDATDLLHVFAYNLGLTKSEPTFAKFNYAEKMEYWAFLWGTVVMTVSGLLLWFNNFTLRYFPKWISDAATAIHYYEALLATFSILIWHFYMVIFDPLVYPMDTAWLDGKVPADHYRHSRPEYYRALQRAGLIEV
ncbi:MAG TPA: cytochrome b/b6 domain-containing protein, partial [Candidatus Binatia bacterium]|nr:cytochrome b/b6 domain-containing protein [Candidatus Binatia bacterium]